MKSYRIGSKSFNKALDAATHVECDGERYEIEYGQYDNPAGYDFVFFTVEGPALCFELGDKVKVGA